MKFHLPPPTELTQELEGADLDWLPLVDHVLQALQEDLWDGEVDVTSEATIGPDAHAEAVFAAREEGVVAGLGVAALVFHIVMGDAVTITDRLPDGTRVSAGDVVMRVAGPTRGLLTAERTALNFASHL
ncbi:MAG: nicotinate-nucleotide diphosphorylase (carboxylating), partial [Nocardioides sp.]